MKYIYLKDLNNGEKIIDGVIMHPLRVNTDRDGFLVESMRTDWGDVYGKDMQFAMQYYSFTKSNKSKDEHVWHLHKKQQDRIVVAKGEVIMAVADKRNDSATKNMLNLFSMSGKEPSLIVIPKNVLHGFLVVSREDALILNFPTILYDPSQDANTNHADALVTFDDDNNFSWDRIRKDFKLKQTKQ